MRSSGGGGRIEHRHAPIRPTPFTTGNQCSKTVTPYMNGGVEFLAWVLESRIPSFTPDKCAQVLEDHLPSPVEDQEEWLLGDEGESAEGASLG